MRPTLEVSLAFQRIRNGTAPPKIKTELPSFPLCSSFDTKANIQEKHQQSRFKMQQTVQSRQTGIKLSKWSRKSLVALMKIIIPTLSKSKHILILLDTKRKKFIYYSSQHILCHKLMYKKKRV